MQRSIVCILFILLTGYVYAQNTTVKLPVVSSAAPVMFRAQATHVGGEPLPNNTRYKVNFGGTSFDEGKNFNKETDEFTAPADGIYHFDIRVSWLQFSANGSVTIDLEYEATSVLAGSTTMPVFDSNYGTLLKLKKGARLSVYLKQNTGTQQKFQQVQLCGYKVN
jgi:hypothetical protein